MMTANRTLCALVGLLLAAGLASAQTYSLAEELKAGDCFRVRMRMTLTGEMRVNRDGKPFPLNQSAEAAHEFAERILMVDKAGLAEKSARRYSTAKASITVGKDSSQRSLPADSGVVVAQRGKDQVVLYNPTNALSHEELDALEHLDTLTLPGLLPGKAVKVEETWKIASTAVQALCHFEGLTEHDLQGKLVEVKDDEAKIAVTGTATGIDLGALAKLTIDASCHFDLKKKRLTRLQWKEKDEREQGPASPAGTVQVTTTAERETIDTPDTLSDVALVSIPEGNAEPPAHVTQVRLVDPKGRFDITHGREWALVGQTDEHVVLRLMERGDFVAQATLTPWQPADKGKHLEAEKFKELMERTPGWEMEKELQAGEVPAEGSRWIYRISALGQLDGSSVMQNFYLIAGPNGDQVVVVFTMTPKQAERLGSRDLSLAGSIDFPKKK
jgi:hypothetical protein